RTAFVGDPAAAMAVADRRGAYDASSSDLRSALSAADVVVASGREYVAPAVALPPDVLVLVSGITPPGEEWRLQPTIAQGAGVRPGYLWSPSTKRLGVITITDLAPTILDALRVPVPDGMIGH